MYMDIISVFNDFFSFLSGVLFYSVIFFIGLMFLFKPKLLFLIPIYIVKGVFFIIFLLVVKLFEYVVVFLVKKELDGFEKYIENVGIKNNIDVGLCHSYFNRVSYEKLERLFVFYLNKATSELNSGCYDDEQIERYIYLLEIMNRCMVFKQANSPN